LKDEQSAQLATQIITKHSKPEKLGSTIQSNSSLSFSFGGVIGGPGAVQVGIFVGGNGVLAPQYTLTSTISGSNGTFTAINLDVTDGVSNSYPFGVFYSVPLPLTSGNYSGSFLIQDSFGNSWSGSFTFSV
jgi:hypothetical protein